MLSFLESFTRIAVAEGATCKITVNDMGFNFYAKNAVGYISVSFDGAVFTIFDANGDVFDTRDASFVNSAILGELTKTD